MKLAEAKKIIDAALHGKKVQLKCFYAPENGGEAYWKDVDLRQHMDFQRDVFRVKPESEYRSFTYEEIVESFTERPMWVQCKYDGHRWAYAIVSVKDDGVRIMRMRAAEFHWISFNELLDKYTFIDGTPCGVEK